MAERKVISQFVFDDYLKRSVFYDPLSGLLTWKTGNLRNPIGSVSNGYLNYTYRYDKGLLKSASNHRVAWFLYHGYWPKNYIDHTNGFKSDNRIINLREATPQQNIANQKKATKRTRKTSSTYKGVSFCKTTKKWRAQITFQGKSMNIGRFNLEIDAAIAYNKAAQTYFGEYASLNTLEVR